MGITTWQRERKRERENIKKAGSGDPEGGCPGI
jgi:hypothetical protein